MLQNFSPSPKTSPHVHNSNEISAVIHFKDARGPDQVRVDVFHTSGIHRFLAHFNRSQNVVGLAFA